jgi:hypothetical protein
VAFGTGWDEENNVLTGAGASFPYGTTILYARWTYDDMSPPWSNRTTWYHNGEIFGRSEGTSEDEAGGIWTHAYLKDKPLAPGTYSLVVEVEGQVVLTGECTIAP